jgi:type I restriction enzyme S subunit
VSVAYVRVGDLAEQVRGVSYGKDDASMISLPGYLPVLRAGNITDDGLVFDDLVFVPAERISSKQRLQRNDVVVAASSGSLDVVGKAAPVLTDFEGGFGAFCKVLRPTDKVYPAYFAHFFKTQDYRRRVSELAAGININNLRNEHLDELRIPLPTFAEQRRIATILDKAEELRVKRRAGLVGLDIASASIFFDLFFYHKQTPITVGNQLEEHPRGWHWHSLKEVARLATGHTPDRKRPNYWNGTIPWITLSEIRRFDGAKAYDTAEHISEIGLENSSAVKLPTGTVCFSRTASVGFVTVMGREMATSQDFVNWVCGPDLDPMYLMHAFLRSRNRLRSLSTGSTHKTIYFPTVEQFRALVPPMDLQREFVRRIGELDRLRSSLCASLANMDALFASLQHRGFRGEL